MIYGIGIDLVDISRIKKAMDRKGNRFAKKILTDKEISLAPSLDEKKVEYIASRFAAKEAVAKAFGTGIGKELGWKDIEILKYDSGRPYVSIKNSDMNSNKMKIHLSISHTKLVAAAKVIVEQI